MLVFIRMVPAAYPREILTVTIKDLFILNTAKGEIPPFELICFRNIEIWNENEKELKV